MAGTGASGRRPLPPALHAIRGTARADRHEGYDVPEPPPGTPEQPIQLEGVAAEEWARMLVRLELTGAMSRAEDGAVYSYCKLFAKVESFEERQARIDASIQVLEDSISDTPKEDRLALFQEIGKMTKLSASYDSKIVAGGMAIRQWLAEFGLTPASRSRVKLPPKKQESKLDKFRRGA